ncbi:MAG: M20/M25/M40 family metallo-hydrolase [Cryomorphaceae bacterium]|nr:M20/M25/M40 family metallo-hydrolase [Cryomorphaceae bacterium]
MIFIFVGYLFFNTISDKIPFARQPDGFESSMFGVDSVSAISHLSKFIQFPTISHKPAMRDTAAFGAAIRYIQGAYPATFSRGTLQMVNSYGTMLWIFGENPGLPPLVLLGHIDVVPVDGNLEVWDEPPFSGNVRDGFIYGRGTLDDKGQVIAMLEALESMFASNVQLDRTVIVCFGHDEEIGGDEGGMAFSEILGEQNISPAMVLDEGGVIANQLVPGVDKAVALIGTSEKGYLNLELSVSIEGGHSSMPERETAIDILGNAIRQVTQKGFPFEISDPIHGFMDYLGPEMPFLQKMAFANRRVFSPLIRNTYEKKAASRALVSTTVVPTIIKSGVKDNVVPTFAKANLNLRLLPGWDAERCIEYLNDLIGDERVAVHQSEGSMYSKASNPSPIDSEAFKILVQTISAHFNDVVPAPYLVLAATDARHFESLTPNVYRFMPFRLAPDDLPRIHGNNERLSIESFLEGIGFYQRFIFNFCNVEKD